MRGEFDESSQSSESEESKRSERDQDLDGDEWDASEELKTQNGSYNGDDDEDSEDSDASGQRYDDYGKPITSPSGRALTPAGMFNPGDVITVTVGKSDPRQDPGLKVEERNGNYYVRKVPSGGLFAQTPILAGDKILEMNGIDRKEFRKVNELKKILKVESRITMVVLRRDPDASDSSASSYEEDNDEYDDDTLGEMNGMKSKKSMKSIKSSSRSMKSSTRSMDDGGSAFCPVKKDSFSLRAKAKR